MGRKKIKVHTQDIQNRLRLSMAGGDIAVEP